jgi:hypothetical protein
MRRDEWRLSQRELRRSGRVFTPAECLRPLSSLRATVGKASIGTVHRRRMVYGGLSHVAFGLEGSSKGYIERAEAVQRKCPLSYGLPRYCQVLTLPVAAN